MPAGQRLERRLSQERGLHAGTPCGLRAPCLRHGRARVWNPTTKLLSRGQRRALHSARTPVLPGSTRPQSSSVLTASSPHGPCTSKSSVSPPKWYSCAHAYQIENGN